MYSKKPELENRRMKQNRGENRHMDGWWRVSHRNHFNRGRRLGNRRRNREPFGSRYGESVDCSCRTQECHGHAEHLHHDTEAEQHDHHHAYFTRAAFVETIVTLLRHVTTLHTSLSLGYKNNR